MGIYDREYYRGATSGSGWLTGQTPVCKWLIIVNVLVFVLQHVFSSPDRMVIRDGELAVVRGSDLTQHLQVDRTAITRRGEVWRLLTGAFCHDTSGFPLHILFNMLFLWWFGREVERLYGSREFLIFYLAAAVFASLCFIGLSYVLRDQRPMIGASGAVLGVTTVFTLFNPRQRMTFFYWLIPITLEMRWWLTIMVALDLWPVLQSLRAGGGSLDGVAHAAHLGGVLFGFAYQRFDLRFGRLSSQLRLSRRGWRRPRLRVVGEPLARSRTETPPEPGGELEGRVDEILEKIKRECTDSLSDKERQLLTEASRRYRERRTT